MNLPLPHPAPPTAVDRRAFLRRSGLVGAAVALAPAASTLFAPSSADAALLADVDILNFALNLEYLEAEYYSYGVYGVGLDEVDTTGTSGTKGTVTVKANPKVNFTNPILKGYATEIANDEIAHVKFLRSALGTAAVAEPSIDLLNSFVGLGEAAGLGAFDPYENENTFLLGGFVFEDVGVTAYHGAAAFISNKTYLSAAASILAVEAYHASLIRTTLYGLNYNDPTAFLAKAANQISQVRDSLDGPLDLDQGITNPDGTSNILPTNGSSIAFSRLPRQVLNIVYASAGASKGGFFPAGVNGGIK